MLLQFLQVVGRQAVALSKVLSHFSPDWLYAVLGSSLDGSMTWYVFEQQQIVALVDHNRVPPALVRQAAELSYTGLQFFTRKTLADLAFLTPHIFQTQARREG